MKTPTRQIDGQVFGHYLGPTKTKFITSLEPLRAIAKVIGWLQKLFYNFLFYRFLIILFLNFLFIFIFI